MQKHSKLFENIVFKPEELIKRIQFVYWHKSSKDYDFFNYHQYKDQWHHFDHYYHGGNMLVSHYHHYFLSRHDHNFQ